MSISRLIVSGLLLLALCLNSQSSNARAATSLAPNVVNQPAAPSSRQAYEGYYLYLGNYPTEANPGWDAQAQGLAHDQDHWFITQKCCLWRIPVTQDLSTVQATSASVSKIEISQVLPRFIHFGDLTYYAFEGRGYLIVPLENHNNPDQCGAIGIFDADTLGLIDSQCLREQGADSGWVAVDPAGILYSSAGSVTAIRKYAVDWPNVKANGKLDITAAGDMEIFDEAGAPLTLSGLQGGEVSPSGELLYLMADGGLQVFDMATQKRIQSSTNGYGYFNYEYHPGGTTEEEPEGITIWDLDDDRAPGIHGQLHAILLDQDHFPPSSDDVYIKHYTNKITVDAARNETISNAINLAWDGAIITVQPGNYPEAITLSKRVQLVAPAGSVQIGK